MPPIESLTFWLSTLSLALLTLATAVLYLTHRQTRATLFTELAVRGAALLVCLFYLSYLAQHAEALPGDANVYAAAVAGVFLLAAGFLLSVSFSLRRFTKQTAGAVVVTPDFLVSLRTRMASMYGEAPSRFIVYAVGKESAHRAISSVAGKDQADAWKQLPRWFRMLGYGKLRYLSQDAGRETRVAVWGTLEQNARTPSGECHLTRGYLAGIGKALVPDMECEVEEIRCAHGKDGECEFAVRWFEPTPAVTPVASVATIRQGA